MRSFTLAFAGVLALVPVLAHAEPTTSSSGLDPLLHLDAGVELEGGRDVSSAAFRGRLLLGNAFGTGSVRPELAAGATLGAGTLYVSDPRGVDGAVGLSMVSFGPEVQVALQFYDDDGDATTRLFASASYFHVNLDDRLMIDPIAGVGGDHGERVSIGVNLARTEVHRASCRSKNDCDLMLLMVLPQQAEIAAERDGGSTRYGATLSWGI